MIPTVSPGTTTHSYKIFCILCWELQRFTLNNFQIYHTVLLIITTMLWIISPWLTYNKFVSPDHPHPFCPPTPQPPASFKQPSICSFHLLSSEGFFFLDSIYKKIIQYLYFSVWLFLLSIVPSRSIHVAAIGRFPLQWLPVFHLVCVSVCMCIYQFSLSIHSFLDTHILAIVNSASVNMGV